MPEKTGRSIIIIRRPVREDSIL